MAFHPPIAFAKQPAEPKALWRRLFMEALPGGQPTDTEIEQALYSAALLSGSPLILVTDALVEMGLRAGVDAFPKPWIAALRGRVLDMAQRQMLPAPLAALAASWSWMSAPLPRTAMPAEIDPECDPYGADLLALFVGELGPQPRFGYTPSMLRLGILKTAVGMGRPLAEVVSALIMRGCQFPADAITAGCREALRLSADNPLVREQIASWQAAHVAMAEIIPLSWAK